MPDLSPRKGMTAWQIAQTIDRVIAEALLEEKVAMMSGKGFLAQIREDNGEWGKRPYRAGAGLDRLNVPYLWFTDGPRGVARGQSTCFPCSMSRGASFDIDLERRIGEIMGIETRAQDCNLSGAVCINLLRHPAWGRAQETYGEDPHHLGEMGAALAVGIQTHNVMATVKHFALNSVENTRFSIDVTIEDDVLREVYLPHFKRVLDAGCATVMSAYNKMNGEYCGQHYELLTDILRGEWGFDGFVHSDWVLGVYKPYGASAGLDVENPEPVVYGERLVNAVEQGQIAPGVIDTACRRILTTLYTFLSAEDPLPEYKAEYVACEDHRAVALEAAEKGAVLLENSGVLPLSQDIGKLAVVGALSNIENTGDFGSSRVNAPYTITPLQGLRDHLGEKRVLHADGADEKATSEALDQADAIVAVVGYTADDEGEYIPGDLVPQMPDAVKEMLDDRENEREPRGGDRASLSLPDAHVALIEKAKATGKPVIVVIVAGSAVMVEEWREGTGAILQTFYSGMEGGTALARLLFGLVTPSGRLPFTVAKDAADYPFFDRTATAITYDRWHGYTKFEREGLQPRYPFGHGLSYTEFETRALRVTDRGDNLEVSVSVHNKGSVAGAHVALAYVRSPRTTENYAERLLRGFTRVYLEPQETRAATILIDKQQLRRFDKDTREWFLPKGRYVLEIDGSSAEIAL
ncbi:beta-glucosidase [Erythrobacter sp. KY5]|uniref:beta-glucosidase family protein n=1 Tax=Erythrobacter sp. KY5 TaxID=2011159 RepID=UPI0013A6E778|nr:glycoside hydrolase family 3 C-terminal domain-containing protein [Erythrobacter sp. KY5]